MKVPSSLTLVEQAYQGDAQAIEALLREYQPELTRFAQKYCRTPQDVEDAVQETLWAASRKIGTVRVVTAVTAWLFTVVRNYCFRLMRSEHDEDGLDSHQSLSITEKNLEHQVALKLDVTQALARLPYTYREVVLMCDVQELTGPETAQKLGVTVETVKARLHRGRALLREALQQWGSSRR